MNTRQKIRRVEAQNQKDGECVPAKVIHGSRWPCQGYLAAFDSLDPPGTGRALSLKLIEAGCSATDQQNMLIGGLKLKHVILSILGMIEQLTVSFFKFL